MYVNDTVLYYALAHYTSGGEHSGRIVFTGDILHKNSEVNFPVSNSFRRMCIDYDDNYYYDYKEKPDNNSYCVIVWEGTQDNNVIDILSEPYRVLTYNDFLIVRDFTSGLPMSDKIKAYRRSYYRWSGYDWNWPSYYRMFRKVKARIPQEIRSNADCKEYEKEYKVKIKYRKREIIDEYEGWYALERVRSTGNNRSWKSSTKKKRQWM